MRQLVGRKLWIGNAGDLRDPRAVNASGIQAIVELADNEQLATLPRDLIRFRFPLSDGGANCDWLIRLAVNSVAALVEARIPTLICCSCGLNRSVCVAAAGLAIVDGRPFHDAILAVAKSGPADVSPGLLAQFQSVLEH
jgi:protein-tyrosine phosphatase